MAKTTPHERRLRLAADVVSPVLVSRLDFDIDPSRAYAAECDAVDAVEVALGQLVVGVDEIGRPVPRQPRGDDTTVREDATV